MKLAASCSPSTSMLSSSSSSMLVVMLSPVVSLGEMYWYWSREGCWVSNGFGPKVDDPHVCVCCGQGKSVVTFYN